MCEGEPAPPGTMIGIPPEQVGGKQMYVRTEAGGSQRVSAQTPPLSLTGLLLQLHMLPQSQAGQAPSARIFSAVLQPSSCFFRRGPRTSTIRSITISTILEAKIPKAFCVTAQNLFGFLLSRFGANHVLNGLRVREGGREKQRSKERQRK